MMHSLFFFFLAKISFHARVTVRTAALWMLHIRTDTRVGKNGLRVLSDLQDINKPGDTGKGDMCAAAAAGDVYIRALLVSGLVSGTAGKKTESVQLPGSSGSAEPRVVNDAFQRRMSRTGSQSIPPKLWRSCLAEVSAGPGHGWKTRKDQKEL